MPGAGVMPAVEPSSADLTHIPRSEAEMVAVGSAIGLTIPAPCIAGVISNLALLDRHAAIALGAQPDAMG